MEGEKRDGEEEEEEEGDKKCKVCEQDEKGTISKSLGIKRASIIVLKEEEKNAGNHEGMHETRCDRAGASECKAECWWGERGVNAVDAIRTDEQKVNVKDE